MTNYPASIQSIPNPTSTDLLENATPELDHDYQHSTANDTIEALEAKVGVDGSAVTTSHDYKLGEVTGSDKAVGKTATQTLTNKTLTSPQINFGSDARGDLITRNSGGTTVRLPIGTSGQILQAGSSGDPEWVANPSASDASTTVKGVVEEATLAETLARTTSGGTSARLFVNPGTLTTVQTYDYAADSVGTDAYAITVTPAPTAYVTGQVFRFKAGTANTGACTLDVNSLGAKTIKKNYNSDTTTGDILANQIVEVIYDGTNFQMQSPTSSGDVDAVSAGLNSTFYALELPMLFRESSASTSMEGWTLTNVNSTSGSTTYNGFHRIGSVASSSFSIASKALWGTGSNSTYDFSQTKTIKLKCKMRFEDTSDRKGFGFVASAATIYTAQTDITNTTVRFILNGSTMYAHNANGSTATTTDVSSGITFTNWNTYEIIFTPGTEAKFYINGNLVATHTTNLPATGTPLVTFGADANGRTIVMTYPIVSIEQ